MSNLKRSLNVLLTAFILLSSTGGVFAQSSNSAAKANGFRISPLRTELTIEKGTSQTATVNIENPSALPIKAKGVINDFIASAKEDGQPELLLNGDFAPYHSLKKLVVDPGIVELAPGERKDVKITISIPLKAAAGGYYGAIRFLPADNVNGGNVALTASVGSLFLVNVPGNIKEHLQLIQFGAATDGNIKKIITSGKVTIITRIKNDGDTHEKPFGKIQVKDSKGKVLAEQEINDIEPQSNVLPGSIRKFETNLKNSKWLGHYTVNGSFGYNPSNGELINAKASFWYIPVWILIALAVLLIALFTTGYVLYRKMQSKRHRKSRG